MKKIKKNKRADFSSEQVLKWILYLALLAVGFFVFRNIFSKLT